MQQHLQEITESQESNDHKHELEMIAENIENQFDKGEIKDGVKTVNVKSRNVENDPGLLANY